MPNPATHMHPSSSTNLPLPPSHAPASVPSHAPAPRSRAQGARKRAAAADDAAYHAAAGTKRTAADRADGDRERVKRKRTDASGAATAGVGGSHNVVEKEEKTSLVSVLGSLGACPSGCYACFYRAVGYWSPGPIRELPLHESVAGPYVDGGAHIQSS